MGRDDVTNMEPFFLINYLGWAGVSARKLPIQPDLARPGWALTKISSSDSVCPNCILGNIVPDTSKILV